MEVGLLHRRQAYRFVRHVPLVNIATQLPHYPAVLVSFLMHLQPLVRTVLPGRINLFPLNPLVLLVQADLTAWMLVRRLCHVLLAPIQLAVQALANHVLRVMLVLRLQTLLYHVIMVLTLERIR